MAITFVINLLCFMLMALSGVMSVSAKSVRMSVRTIGEDALYDPIYPNGNGLK